MTGSPGVGWGTVSPVASEVLGSTASSVAGMSLRSQGRSRAVADTGGPAEAKRVEEMGSPLGPGARLKNAPIRAQLWKLEALHCPVAKETGSA